VTALERRCRWLLRAYPSWYRRQRGEEMLATLLEASSPGRRWPSWRDARALMVGGLRVRAWGNRRQSAAASVRLAVLFGSSLALLWAVSGTLSFDIAAAVWRLPPWAASNPDIGYWIAADALVLAAVAAAWFAARPVAAVIALAAAVAAAREYWGDWNGIELAGLLIVVAILVSGRHRMPRSWLWLAVGIFAANVLDQLINTRLAYARYVFVNPPLVLVPWIVLGVVVLWAAVDARPAMAIAVWIASETLVFHLVSYISYGVMPAGPGLWQWPWQWYLLAAGSAVLAAAAMWRLRHQAAL
jgi:hypothetical protein